MWRFRSSQKKSVASVVSYVRKRTGKAHFNPAPTTDAGEGSDCLAFSLERQRGSNWLGDVCSSLCVRYG